MYWYNPTNRASRRVEAPSKTSKPYRCLQALWPLQSS
jgi:hypothetical protein